MERKVIITNAFGDYIIPKGASSSSAQKGLYIGRAFQDVPKVYITSELLTVNGNTISPLTTSKNTVGDTSKGDMMCKFVSNTVNFEEACTLAYQGNSTLAQVKKGFRICFKNKRTFADWLPFDEYNMKGNYEDWTMSRDIICNKLMEQIYRARPFTEQRPWMKYNDTLSLLQTGASTKATCHIDGFPVELYINGTYWGLYSLNNKKERDLLLLDKSNPLHIRVEPDMAPFYPNIHWGDENFNWRGVEVSSPKGLLCTTTKELSGFGYDELTDAEEIASIGENFQLVVDKPTDFTNDYIVLTYGNEPPTYLYRTSKSKWYKLAAKSGYAYVDYDGDNPTELIDSTMEYYNPANKNHVMTDSVKRAVAAFNAKLGSITDETTNEQLEEFMNIQEWVDYILLMWFIDNHDCFGKNTQFTTWDAQHWSLLVYDLGQCFGWHDGSIYAPTHVTLERTAYKYCPWLQTVENILSSEFKKRYAELRDAGVFTVENVVNMFEEYTGIIGMKVYENNMKRWPDTPSYVSTVNQESIPRILEWLKVRIEYLDNKYGYHK